MSGKNREEFSSSVRRDIYISEPIVEHYDNRQIKGGNQIRKAGQVKGIGHEKGEGQARLIIRCQASQFNEERKVIKSRWSRKNSRWTFFDRQTSFV